MIDPTDYRLPTPAQALANWMAAYAQLKRDDVGGKRRAEIRVAYAAARNVLVACLMQQQGRSISTPDGRWTAYYNPTMEAWLLHWEPVGVRRNGAA